MNRWRELIIPFGFTLTMVACGSITNPGAASDAAGGPADASGALADAFVPPSCQRELTAILRDFRSETSIECLITVD